VTASGACARMRAKMPLMPCALGEGRMAGAEGAGGERRRCGESNTTHEERRREAVLNSRFSLAPLLPSAPLTRTPLAMTSPADRRIVVLISGSGA
jgi:hypothetical protein